MKRIILFTVTFLLIAGGVSASSINGDYNGRPIVKVTFQGKELAVEDVPGQILDDRTMVPLYMLKQLGYDLTWDADHYSVDIKPTQQAANRHKLTGAEVAKLRDAVGYLVNYQSNGVPYGQGTGFIISKDGLMISAAHMLPNNLYMQYTNNGDIDKFQGVDFQNTKEDIFGATLGKVSGRTYPYLNYTTDLPKEGDHVWALGYPGGDWTITDGFVSSISDVSGIMKIVTSAKTDHGSSGGVLLNDYGEALGVTVGGGTLDGYAIPMMYVQQELDKLH